MEGNLGSELAASVFSLSELAGQSGGDPVRRFINLSEKSGYPGNGAVDFVGRHILEGMAGRSVAQICDLVVTMARIDQRRQAGRLAGKPGQHDTALALVHQPR